VKDEILTEIRNLWDNHKSASLGVLLGLLFGVFVLVFGFWNMIFVALCAGLGLFIGAKRDKGEDVMSKTYEYVKANWKRG